MDKPCSSCHPDARRYECEGSRYSGAEPMRSAYLTLNLETAEKAEEVYELLSKDGEIFMRMEQTPFANRFAMLRDKFGTSWMLLNQG